MHKKRPVSLVDIGLFSQKQTAKKGLPLFFPGQFIALCFFLYTDRSKNFFQCIFTAGAGSHKICLAPLRLLRSAAGHLMGNCIGKKHDQIRASDLFSKTCRHLGKNLCPAVISLTDLFVLTCHPVMAADDYDTHINPFPFCFSF